MGKFLPSDTITISKQGKRVVIRFTVHKMKKFSFSRRPTIIIFDFANKPKNCLHPYAMWLVDEQTQQVCLLNKKFDLVEKKFILTGMVTHKNKRIKQNEGDVFQASTNIDTRRVGSQLLYHVHNLE